MVLNMLTFGVFAETIEPAMRKAKSPVTINVGKDEKFQFHSIQEALDSVREEPTAYAPLTIVINEGVYEEEIDVKLPYVNFKAPEGKDPKNIVITYDKANGHVDDPNKAKGTQQSATVTLEKSAVGFSAERITFENSYNIGEEHSHRPQAQAVALVSMTDKVVFDSCRFIGRQDTLYLKGASKGKDVFGDSNNARTYLKNCYIEGTVDYIFGDGTAYFDNCSLNMTYRENGGHYTAANTTLSNIGYVFYKCTLTADQRYGNQPNKVVDLGRPWQGDSSYPYYGSHTVFIDCIMPDSLNSVGFVPWNNSTIKNKIRYMEYGSVNSNGDLIELAPVRNDFMKLLTKEQAESYTPYNILKGNDGWKPLDIKREETSNVLDITLDKYSLSIPQNSSETVRALVLPLNADNKNVKWSIADENIAKVDENGVVSGIAKGKTTLIAETEENGFKVSADVEITAAKTSLPIVKDIKINGSNIKSGTSISLDYNYELKSDDIADNALIKWYAVDSEGNEYALKQGRGKEAKTYVADDFDVGYKIKAYVYPETITTYGESGSVVSAETEDFVVSSEENIPTLYLRDNFSDISKHWNYNDNLLVYKPRENESEWKNIVYNARLRFNPLKEGISSSDSIDFYTAFSGKDKSYYRLNVKRGSNTDSLKVYFYKKNLKEDEVLIASDEESLSKKIPQARGEENPFFTIKETIHDGNISIDFTIEGQNSPAMSMSFKDDSPLSGFIAFESTSEALLKSALTVGKPYSKKENDNVIKICLAGDSTVKSYGNDNTIGGWGEYLQHYFDSDHVKIINKAEGGRSTRSYINQGRLADAVSEIGEGDYLFIQFGHNDARTDENALLEHSVPLGAPDANGIYPTCSGVKSKTPKSIYGIYKDMPYSEDFYSYDSGGTFKWFLKQYVDEARKVGATPVLITPVARVFFDKDGKITPHHGDNDGYVKAVLQLAEEMDVACVDMFDITKTMYENYGVRVTQSLQNIKSDGTMDITHYNKFGSNIVTSKLIEALRQEGIYACVYSKPSDRAVSKTEDLKNAMVYIVGGTSVASPSNTSAYSLPKEGWGDYVQSYFSDQITVLNMAVDGKSSKSYIMESNYKKVFANIAEGDYILINFGVDDFSKTNADNYTDPKGSKEKVGSFKYYLYNYYIKPALNKKAVPIIVSPCAASVFGDDKKLVGVYSDYIDAIKEISAETGAYYINLNDILTEHYNTNGETKADGYHALYKNNSDGKNGIDVYALSKTGAVEVGRIVLRQIGFSSATLKDYISSSLLDNTVYVEKGEFVTDILKLIDDDENIEYLGENFADISNGKTYAEAVGRAKQLGIIKGDDNNLFYPENDISVNELIEITENILSLKNKKLNFNYDAFVNLTDEKVSIEQEAYVLNKVYEALQS